MPETIILPGGKQRILALAGQGSADDSGTLQPRVLPDYARAACRDLVLAEPAWISPQGTGALRAPGIARESHIAAWSAVADAVHAAGGRIALVITGRKRYQTAERRRLPLLEATEDGRFRLNPLAAWTAGMIEAYRTIHGLPAHPMAAQGYPSVGCRHCTDRVAPGEDARAGRWRGRGKAECGMHPRAAGPAE
ncbi:phosphoadenosine phosphosulfate reductase family protein [Roseomonas sp. JC162]|uniref:Phosphoadenosine phosphosulfate reductase family protein n=1 Tax=Neoroseomonas marina TaxID=1232220 RepID=A0A848EM72_9PROT|nr:phosphoadenosine phosphosulfate reductase family protein [Neoroseomonas marina]NMJ44480.1 phosphoadenosine phosphosulfate reductase family protein [Neoroseomonas marina]